MLLHLCLIHTSSLSNVHLNTFTGGLQMPGVLKVGSSLMGQQKLVPYLSGKCTIFMLFLITTLLIQLMVSPTVGKKAIGLDSL